MLEGVRIEELAAEGNAMARVNGKVVFVPFAAPGDIVDIQVTKSRKSYMEGYVVRFQQFSTQRVEPLCEHFGLCGGCKWQHIPYSQQLAQKQRQVSDQLARIGKIELPEILPIIGSKNTNYYRNKLEFTFSNSRWLTREEITSSSVYEQNSVLGFHVPGKFDKVFDVRNCYLQPEPSNAIRLAVDNFAKLNGYEYFDIRSKTGFLRNLIIRTTSLGDVMVILVAYSFDKPKIHSLLEFLKTTFPAITSLMYVVNPKLNDTIHDLELSCYFGNDFIVEEMEEIQFRISPKSFYQTNSQQAYELYKVVRSFASLTGSEIVYDLYTGTGTIANFIARDCRKVVGIEYVDEAVEDARINSKLNGIDNTQFLSGDMKDILTEGFIQCHGSPQVIILDPPRAGVHPDVVKALLSANPDKIIYVSCNPATQARDISLLDNSYKVAIVQPVDMFPHTHHVENVVLLERRIKP